MNFITILQEMAATHMDNSVGELMAKGRVIDAVRKYIKNMESKNATIAKNSTAVTNKIREGRAPKSLKIDKKILDEIPNERWDEFDEIYRKTVSGEGVKKSYKTQKGKTIKTKDGEEIVITSGQKQKVIKDELETKMLRIKKEFEDQLSKVENEVEKERIKEHIRGLDIAIDGLRETHRRPVLDADPKDLKNRYDKITKEYKAKNEDYDDNFVKRFEAMNKEVIDLYKKLLNTTKDPRRKESIRKDIEMLKGMKPFRGNIKEGNVFIPYDDKMKMLSEAIQYEGTNFSENYVFSGFVKSFYKDKETYGLELTEEIYTIIYGEDINAITSCLVEHEEFLDKAGASKSSLLFEGCSEIPRELSESVWDVIKQFGGAYIGKIQKFLGQGVSWAKELMSKGISFFTDLPITQIAVPAIAIAGGITAGVKLINKIRKKAGKNPLSKEEKENFKEALKAKKDEVAKYV